MPHIHTQPGQHDMTVSAYIVRLGDTEPKILVHMHKKHKLLLQIGGHIELNETPWQAIAHELAEESGYSLEDLDVLQPDEPPLHIDNVVIHPLPILLATYRNSNEHYHSDLYYAFATSKLPSRAVRGDESADLRWLTMTELKSAVRQGIAARDIEAIYERIITWHLLHYKRVPASSYSLGKPHASSM